MHILIAALHRPTKPTGVCRYAANLAQCLADNNQVAKVTLVVGEWQYDYFKTIFSLESPKIHLISISIQNNSLSRNFWFLRGLPKLARTFCPDIIHLSFPIPFLRSSFTAPIVSTIHDLYPYEYPENFGYPRVLFNRLFLRQSIHQSDGLSCVSQSTLESLKHYFPGICDRKITTVIYNCVDFSQLKPQQPSFVFDPNQSFLLCVAQHRKNKNLNLLIQAFASLRQKGALQPTVQLILVGNSGPETSNLTDLINQLSLQDEVLMLSALNDSELNWLYQNCQLFVIPSSTEGFCLPLAEALYSSCRVVCSDISVFKEVGSEQCIYFDLKGRAVENLVQAIAHALNSIQNKNYKDNRFSKENISQQCLDLYYKISQSTPKLVRQC